MRIPQYLRRRVGSFPPSHQGHLVHITEASALGLGVNVPDVDCRTTPRDFATPGSSLENEGQAHTLQLLRDLGRQHVIQQSLQVW